MQKVVLFFSGDPRIKRKSRNNGFDVPQGSFAVAVVSEIIGIQLLSKMNELVNIKNHGLYGDDGLICVNANISVNEVIRKKLFKVIEKLCFKNYCRKKYENTPIFGC